MIVRDRRVQLGFLLVLLVAMIGVAVYTFRPPADSQPELSAEQIERLGQGSASPAATPAPGQSPSPVADSAPRETVVKFVLAAASPVKAAPTEADKQAALGYLSEELKAKAAGNPQTLLGIAQPASFQVGEANVRRDKAATGIVFKFSGAADTRFDVLLEQQGGRWVITEITKINQRQG